MLRAVGPPVRGRRLAATVVGAAVTALALGTGIAEDTPGTTVTIHRAAPSTTQDAAGYEYGAYYGAPGYQAQAPVDRAAVVVDRRQLALAKGDTELEFGGVPTEIRSATVLFRSLTDPTGTKVLEQRFAYDLSSPDAVLRAYVGHEIVVATEQAEVSGILRAFTASHLLIDTNASNQRLHVLERRSHIRDIKFTKLTEALVFEPTLVWKVNAETAGDHLVEVTYQTDGMSWDTDYTAVYDEAKGTIDLSAWVTIDNHSGANFSDSRVILVSSDAAPRTVGTQSYGTTAAASDDEPWSYSLAQVAQLPDGATTHFELFAPIVAAPAARLTVYEPLKEVSSGILSVPDTDCYGYRYDTTAIGLETDDVVQVSRNTVAGATTFPKGTVHVYQERTGTDALELLAENPLQVDPDTGTMRIRVGTNPDVTGQRRQLDCSADLGRKRMRERIEIVLKNSGARARDVVVREYMQRWSSWKIDIESMTGAEAGGVGREYHVNVPAGEAKTITYTVIYTW